MTRRASPVSVSVADLFRAVARPEVGLRILAAATSASFLTIYAIKRHDLFYSNQNTYFPAALYRSGREFLQHDWFAQTRPPHLFFTYLIAALDRLQLLSIGVAVLEVLLEAALLLSIWLIAGGLLRKLARNSDPNLQESSYVALTSIVFSLLLLGLQRPAALRDLLDALHGGDLFEMGRIWEREFLLVGLAAQYIWGSYLQPSEFGILLLLSIGVMLHERWRLGALLAGLATVMHAGYLPHAALLVLATAAWLYRSERRRVSSQLIAIFGVVALPVVIYALTFAFQPEAARAYDILANFRTPHHSIPSAWWSNVALGQILLMTFAGLLLLWKRAGFLAWVVNAGVAYTVLGILSLWFVVDSDALALTFPWRGSAYLAPLTLVVIAVFTVYAALQLARRISSRPLPLTLIATGIAGLTLIATVDRALETEPCSGEKPHADVAAMVRRETSLDDVILAPDSWEDFRLVAERAIYVDFKSHPYLAPEVIEWRRRIETNRHFYQAPEAERGEICAMEGIDYYVISTDVQIAVHQEVAEAAGYRLVACPGQ